MVVVLGPDFDTPSQKPMGFDSMEVYHAQELFQNYRQDNQKKQSVFFHQHLRSGCRNGLLYSHPPVGQGRIEL